MQRAIYHCLKAIPKHNNHWEALRAASQSSLIENWCLQLCLNHTTVRITFTEVASIIRQDRTTVNFDYHCLSKVPMSMSIAS